MSNPYKPTTQVGPLPKPQYGGQGTNGLAIASVSLGGVSLACSLIGVCCCFFWFAPILSVAAIVCGVVGIMQINASGQRGKELCWAGIGMGIAGPAILVILIILQAFMQIGNNAANNFNGF